MSRFLDIEAQLDSENDYEDDEDEVRSAAQDDDDFIDDSIRPRSFAPPPPLPELEEQFAFDESQYTSRRSSEFLEDDPVYTRSLQNAQSEGMARVLQDRQFVYGILKRTESPENRTFNHATSPRAPIPPDARERYAHFQRPQRFLVPQPTSQSEPSSAASTGVLPPDLTFNLDPSDSPPVQQKRKLSDLSVSSAPHGTFVRKKPRLNVDLKEWSQWAAGKRQRAPDEDIRRREIAPGEWVKVSRGLYKGDIGIVWKPDSTSSGETGYFLLLIPRLSARNSNKGRREWPAPCRFKPEAFGSEPKKGEEPQTFRFRDKTFSHGLLVKFFEERSVETVYFAPSEVHNEFSKSKHPFVCLFPFPLPEFYAFEVGDKVEAAGQVGKVKEVLADMCLVDYGDAGMHTGPSRLLQKHIIPGDPIRVVVGEHEGQEGLVAERHGSLLYVSQRHSKTGIDFFVHINSVRVQPETFNGTLPEDVPWIDTRVVICRGRYSEMHGYVKGVRVSRYGGSLALLLYLPVLACSVEEDYDNIVEQSTTKKLLEYRPLTAEQKKFEFDPKLAEMCTGRVPWLGTRVTIIKGIHKGKGEGIVRDLITTNTSNRIEVIDYAHVREVDSGLELAKFMPLSKEQKFFTPYEGIEKQEGEQKGKVPVHHRKFDPNPYLPPDDLPLSSATPQHESSPEEIDWDNPFDPWNPHSLSPAVWSSRGYLSPAAAPPTPLHISTSPIPSTPGSPNSSRDKYLKDLLAPPTSSLHPLPALPPTPSLPHPLLHPKLLGITIRVAITEGRWKRKTAFVTPTSSDGGAFFTFRLKGETHRIDHRCIGKHPERPRPNSEQGLMVVTGGREQHIGKFVRRIFYFYNEQKTQESRWFILGVVDRSGRSDRLTKEYLELPPTDVDIVEESKEDRETGNRLFEDVRYSAKVGNPETRRPGERSLAFF
ncbi:hypothetical protein V5O48_013418 [Marasmius crinis-equi]|uniref:KOW domain-containing protein n=1 Tax=Marasmius crinis-equi TaxID=585013 RepID=A0ABR3F056_9AGAR